MKRTTGNTYLRQRERRRDVIISQMQLTLFFESHFVT